MEMIEFLPNELNIGSQDASSGLQAYTFIDFPFILSSCGNDQPVGAFMGKIQDWVHEVFQARVIKLGGSLGPVFDPQAS